MRNWSPIRLAAIVGLAPAVLLGQPVFPEIQSLVVFGDTYSDAKPDSGNLLKGPGQEVWADFLADALGVPRATPYVAGSSPNGKNFATFGARAAIHPPFPSGPLQIDSYLVDQLQGATPPAGTLYVLWFGFLEILNAEATPVATADRVRVLLDSLLQAGATQFLVPELFPLGMVPDYEFSANAVYWNGQTAAFNAALAIHLDELRALHPNARFIRVRTYALFEDFAAHPADWGFVDTTNPVFQLTDPSVDRDTYLWWGLLYPTTAAYEKIADFAFAEIDRALSGAALSDLSLSIEHNGASWSLEVRGPTFPLLQVESSTDGDTWLPLRGFTPFDGSESIGLTIGVNETRFFRAVE